MNALAWRLARRELRGGIRGFRIFLACLALGVAAIAAVGSVRMAIQEGLTREGAAILGGDVALRMTYRFATEEERAWMTTRAETVAEIADFRSLLSTQNPDTGERERALTQVKAVDNAYPIYGEVRLDPPMSIEEALETRDKPGLVAERTLMDRLALEVGDTVRLGTTDFELRAALTLEPDSGGAGFSLGPRTIVALDALADSGLLAQGSLFEIIYRLKLGPNPNFTALEADLKASFPDAGIRWRDSRNGAPGIARFVQRLGAFLVLVGLASLAVGGIGVSSAVRAYLDRKTETIATLKTLGAGGGLIFATYLIQIGLLTVLGIALGLLIGAGGPWLMGEVIAAALPVPALFDIYMRPMVEAGLYGILTALIFSIWPLARAREIRAAGLFRDLTSPLRQWPRPVFIALVAALTVALIALAAWFSGIWLLALWTAGGILTTLVILLFAARGASWLAGRLARSRLVRGRPALRLALASVAGPGGETSSAVLSLGLGLTVLATVGQIDFNMQSLITQDLPDRAPAYFVVDIQNDQLGGFKSIATDYQGVSEVATAPMLRGVITALKGVPAREAVIDPNAAWVLRGDRGVTYSAAPPKGTVVTEGEWWPEDYAGPPLVSFADEEGRELGLAVGDTITVNVLGRDIEATVASFRVVNFRDMGINFLMVFDPNVMRGAPHTHLATIYATPAAEGPLLRTLADAYPNISAIRVRDAIGRVSDALRDLGTATRWGAAAVLITGFVVLLGAAAAGEKRRVFEAAVLKTLGATRQRILSSFALRAGLLGVAAGLVAIAAGSIAGWAVITFVMEADFRFALMPSLLIVVGGVLASLLAGLLFALRPLAARPAQILRSRD